MTARFDGDASRALADRAATTTVSKTGKMLTDGVLSGYAWDGNSITYAFPDQASDYNYGTEPNRNFKPISELQKDAARAALDRDDGIAGNNGFSVEGFTKLSVSPGSDSGATIRYADSNAANPTAYAYYPSSSGNGKGGDVWFGNDSIYNTPEAGNYAYATILHETGHALGLKHGHQATSFDKIKTELRGKYDSLEYSVMTYHSYAGQTGAGGYTNEQFGFPQSYMMADISALQHMYGADFSTNAGRTVYSWSPNSGKTFVNGEEAIEPGANRIFATIWDGSGHNDEYDLSAYSTRVVIDLQPGNYSVFKSSQLADLDFSGGHNANGNIYNALLFRGNKDSLIENAEGGSGNDRLTGNIGRNYLDGNAGDDTLIGLKGRDTYHGDAGRDVFVFDKHYGVDTIDDFDNGKDKINLTGFDLKNFASLEGKMSEGGGDVEITLGGGDRLELLSTTVAQLDKSDFVL